MLGISLGIKEVVIIAIMRLNASLETTLLLILLVGKGDKWRPPTRARTFGARHLALWTFGARTIGVLDNWHPGHFAPGHLAVETIGALENWRSGTFGAQTFGAPDIWRFNKLPFPGHLANLD